MTSTITSKGQITIPKEVRDKLGLKPGTQVRFIIDEAGQVALSPVLYSLDDLFGFLGPAPEKLSLEEIDTKVQAVVSEHVLRS